MQQHTHIFYQLETTETMRAFIAHNMDGSEDLLASLETTKSETAIAWKLAKEGVDLLRKAKEEKKVVQAKARRLAEEKEVMAVDKKKVEKKVAQLRQKLQDLRVDLSLRRMT